MLIIYEIDDIIYEIDDIILIYNNYYNVNINIR